jgi:hypothetical protein
MPLAVVQTDPLCSSSGISESSGNAGGDPSGSDPQFGVGGKADANWDGMSTRLQTLILLANAIYQKREKLDFALTDARRRQLSEQISFLTKRFQRDYAEVIEGDDLPNPNVSRFRDKLDRLPQSGQQASGPRRG